MKDSEVNIIKQREVSTDAVNGTRSEEVTQQVEHKIGGSELARNIITTIYGIVAGLLGIRFVLSLLGANRSNTFASIIYTVTEPLVAPFRSLFNVNETVGNGLHRFEVETLVAIVVYGLIAWVLIRLFSLRKPEQ